MNLTDGAIQINDRNVASPYSSFNEFETGHYASSPIINVTRLPANPIKSLPDAFPSGERQALL